jgi:hypothetical protein
VLGNGHAISYSQLFANHGNATGYANCSYTFTYAKSTEATATAKLPLIAPSHKRLVTVVTTVTGPQLLAAVVADPSKYLGLDYSCTSYTSPTG